MTDRVFVTGLALHAYHGVMEHEAKVGQTFKLDLTLDMDLTEAARTDKLADTVGYDQVVDVASKTFCANRYRLVEAAAGAVADAVLARFPAGDRRARHRAQAARADRRDLRGRRRFDPAFAPWLRRWSRSAATSATRGGTLDRAIAQFCDGKDVRLLARSSDYRTPPWGVLDQPPFVNCCIAASTGLSPQALLAARAGGRARLRPRPQQTSSAGARARSTSTSSPMTM